MGIIRDFTDNTRSILEAEVAACKEEDESLGIFSEFYDFVTNAGINVDYESYKGQVDNYYHAVVDKNNMTLEGLDRIFQQVASEESTFMSALASIEEQANLLAKTMEEMASLFDVNSIDGSGFALARPHDDFRALLDGITAPYYSDLMGRLVSYDADGNPVYDWDEIDAILNKAPEDITEFEYLALASLYVTMDTANTEMFLRVLADKTEDCSPFYPPPTTGFPSKYTTWEYNQDKIDGLQRYILSFIENESRCQFLLYHLPDADIEYLFATAYPDEANSEMSVDNKEKALIAIFDARVCDLMQKSAFLSIVGGLQDSIWMTGSVGGLSSVSYESGPLTGEAGAIGPAITLLENLEEGGYYLGFCNIKSTSIAVHESTSTQVNNMNPNMLKVSPVVSNFDITDTTANNLFGYYQAKYAFDFGATAFENTGNLASDTFRTIATDEISTHLGARVTGRFASRAIGLIPVIGDGISFVTDMGIDYYGEKAESAENLRELRISDSNIKLANGSAQLWMNAVIVTDGTSPNMQMYAFPTLRTASVVNNANDYLADVDPGVRSAQLQEYGLEYPLTVDDAVNNTAGVGQWLNSLPPGIKDELIDPDLRGMP
jgi:hypothetical protein